MPVHNNVYASLPGTAELCKLYFIERFLRGTVTRF
jgi:hypothetical protein